MQMYSQPLVHLTQFTLFGSGHRPPNTVWHVYARHYGNIATMNCAMTTDLCKPLSGQGLQVPYTCLRWSQISISRFETYAQSHTHTQQQDVQEKFAVPFAKIIVLFVWVWSSSVHLSAR